jgi:hypothetical protein
MPGVTPAAPVRGPLAPELGATEYVFCTVSAETLAECEKFDPIALVREKEGLSLIVDRATAEREGLACSGTFKRISLGAPTSLEAVGLTAELASALASKGISANVVAGYYHDHFFVPADRALEALQTLASLPVKGSHP